jgi:3-deoxy-manno-octulosonate cytidylyltransferase (CMP-KDO synthetase)
LATFRVVIPARYASTRLPGKPLVEIAGRPMLAHVHARACESGAAEVLIATDDARIAEAATRFGATVCMTATTHTSGTERLAEVAEQRGWPDDALVVNLQGDEPCMPPTLIAQVAEDLAAHDRASCATLAAPIRDAQTLFDPNVVKVVCDAEGYALYFSRAPIPWARDAFAAAPGVLPDQDIWLRHIGLYAYRAGLLRRYRKLTTAPLEAIEALEQLRLLWHGLPIHLAAACHEPGPGVDTPEDLARVRAALA